MSNINQIVNELEQRAVFSREEIITLLRSVYADKDEQVVEYAEKLYLWAEGIRKSAVLLDMILRGVLHTTFKDGELQLALTELASEVQKHLVQK